MAKAKTQTTSNNQFTDTLYRSQSMWYQESTDKIFNYAVPLKQDGQTISKSVFRNPDYLASLDIYPAEYSYIDNKYYDKGAETKTFDGSKWTFSWEEAPKEFATLQQELIRYWLRYLDETLMSTDKYLTRKAELEQWFSKWDINPALQEWRDGVYLLFNTRMNSVTEAVTFEGLIVADEQPFTIPAQPNPFSVEN